MNCIYWLQLLPYHDFQIGLIIFQLASFSSKINVYPKQVVYGEKKYSANSLYETVSAHIFKMYGYMHDKENIFVSLVKSAPNI